MQMLEDEVKSITAIAHSSVNRQAFQSDALAFPSQAETTLNHYSPGGKGGGGGYKSDGSGGYRTDDLRRSLGKNDSCFGCKLPHPWM